MHNDHTCVTTIIFEVNLFSFVCIFLLLYLFFTSPFYITFYFFLLFLLVNLRVMFKRNWCLYASHKCWKLYEIFAIRILKLNVQNISFSREMILIQREILEIFSLYYASNVESTAIFRFEMIFFCVGNSSRRNHFELHISLKQYKKNSNYLIDRKLRKQK